MGRLQSFSSIQALWVPQKIGPEMRGSNRLAMPPHHHLPALFCLSRAGQSTLVPSGSEVGQGGWAKPLGRAGGGRGCRGPQAPAPVTTPRDWCPPPVLVGPQCPQLRGCRAFPSLLFDLLGCFGIPLHPCRLNIPPESWGPTDAGWGG